MSKLELKKNNETVLSKDGIMDGENYVFENIIYNPNELTLIREDENFKYFLDFKNSKSTVTIKQNDYALDLQIKTTKMDNDNKKHQIYYNIESDEEIENQILITFK